MIDRVVSKRRLSISIFATLFAALPFAFGIIRAVQTRRDLRYLVVAVVAGASALLGVRLVDRLRRRGAVGGALARALVVLVVATIVGGLVAGAMTRFDSVGAWVVVFAFAFCFAASAALASMVMS